MRTPHQTTPPHAPPRPAVLGAVTLAILALCGCGDGLGQGRPCDRDLSCQDGLQCFENVCVAECVAHEECGDGHVCDDGRCELVEANIGDACQRELDCAPGQSCVLTEPAVGGGGPLAATCQLSGIGAVTGSVCAADSDCRNRGCNFGRCTELCSALNDCPGELECTRMPRLLDEGHGVFLACLPTDAILQSSIQMSAPSQRLRVPVPANARSFSIFARALDTDHRAGVDRVRAPTGRILYRTPETPEQFESNLIRYTRADAESMMLIPNTPAVSVVDGVYEVDVSTELVAGVPGSAVPEVSVLYTVGEVSTLDLNFYFLDLADHPCQSAWGDVRLDATTAQLAQFSQLVGELGQIFAPASITLGKITYRNLPTRPDLDGLTAGDLRKLLAESDSTSGLDIFVVRSIRPDGILALAGGQPGAPAQVGFDSSGVAISADALCYRDFAAFGRITAHALARTMGLFRNREPNSQLEDPIIDSYPTVENLMHFSDLGGRVLSRGQIEVLRNYPGLR